jgi:hypothetical protein
MLDEELAGGHKVHEITAGLLYSIDPEESHSHKVNLQGNMVPAYKGGKRVRHAWHYGMRERKMAQTFWISLTEAERLWGTMADLHPQIPPWWKELGDEVFGVPRYVCPRCEEQQSVGRECQICAKRLVNYVPRVTWDGYQRAPARVLYTPFGRRRFYLGRRSEGMNAVISQKPQSCGISMWYRSIGRLNGLDVNGEAWPVVEGARVFSGIYSDLTDGICDPDLATGTYDSFLVETLDDRTDDVLQWLAWTMEQPWPQLGGRRFPVDMKIGYNWGEVNEQNREGLTGVEYTPFTAGRDPAW